ncbi:mitochondrial potassium channel ATP-binding subunit-like [Portunus trituberculatus]|uniref:mitochondrial potassium channel ATP-binding subunit-like n=1 Tax=Portunus trituberculatus TaxID=210409 RepID=UPI001E1CDC36|nr:mitochondrial potassium channel ATP-binding subunit-like [Portunus trituberculatus]XP_045131654.1 mitochondrial potassium channel ATP-binding subunit-like [Portunus trituberculatus]XP_045131655.1 mitochondrial potassium channel ATP-binding subunit-like [Portunus trituberculatus]XP_045131656.1 mitochondrial potassium channel ATP-binding subunit-like [Portunus trituberculatus]
MMLLGCGSPAQQALAQVKHGLSLVRSSKMCVRFPLRQGRVGNFRNLSVSEAAQTVRGSGLPGGGVSLLLRVSIGTGCFFTIKALTTPVFSECKAHKPAKEIYDRRLGAEDSKDTKDPPFDWLAFWHLLKPQLHHFLAAVVSALVVSLANIQVPILLGEVVNVVARFTSETARESRSFPQEIAVPVLKLVKYYFIQAAFTLSYISFLTRMGERIADDLRKQLFATLLKQDMAFYDQHKTGELVNRLTADVQDFKSSFKLCISQGMRSVTQIIGCGISLYMISPQLAGLTGVFVPVVIGVGTALGSLLRSLSREAQHQVARATAVADECLANMRTVRAFAMEDSEKNLFTQELDKSRQLNEALGMGIGIFQAGSNLFLNGIVLGCLWCGGQLMATSQLQPGDLMSFLVAAQTIQKSLAQLGIMFGTYVRGISAGARVFEYVKLQPTIPMKGGKIIPYHTLMGNIEFRNVSFAYPTRSDQEVLGDFSLIIPAGSIVALVGVSGGGKSTVAQLLERFYDVSSGSITIDGEDLRTLDPSWLRGRVIGFINQEPVLFATSIMENIRYGFPDATDAEVIEAAKKANAHNFIKAFPSGYNTVVGERGVTVSGGQKQRIAIARALLKNPRILVLDEATSALDAESEAVVQAALESCLEGRTVLVIAHRLSTIQKADLIAVMSHGKLAETGKHETLKKAGGIYAELIRQQQREEKASKTWGF